MFPTTMYNNGYKTIKIGIPIPTKKCTYDASKLALYINLQSSNQNYYNVRKHNQY